MYVVMGASGHVGSAVAEHLLQAGEAVTVVLRDPRKGMQWRDRGAAVAIADIMNTEALRAAFRLGQRAFLLNPPAPVSGDTDLAELATGRAIAEAIDGSGMEFALALSTYGAQPGTGIGDLGTLFAFEKALDATNVPIAIQRSAYLMSNWDGLLDAARSGRLPTMLDADRAIPMVAPDDLGAVAAARMRSRSPDGVVHVEGPDRYSPRDVADAFARALGTAVAVVPIPREEWERAYRDFGFSEPASRSYTAMTAISVDGGFEMPADVERGTTTLEAYIEALVGTSS